MPNETDIVASLPTKIDNPIHGRIVVNRKFLIIGFGAGAVVAGAVLLVKKTNLTKKRIVLVDVSEEDETTGDPDGVNAKVIKQTRAAAQRAGNKSV